MQAQIARHSPQIISVDFVGTMKVRSYVLESLTASFKASILFQPSALKAPITCPRYYTVNRDFYTAFSLDSVPSVSNLLLS